MRNILLILTIPTALLGQSISVTSPTANQVLFGYSGFSFTASVSSLPATARVCYTIDAYPAQPKPCSLMPGWSVSWNTFNALNGPHQVVATAYDILGNVLATSSAVAFTTANTWPVPYNPSMTVSTGTALTSNWSGPVSITPTISGSGSGDNKTFYYWIDGILQFAHGTSSASDSLSVDTTQFTNGQHIVAVTMQVQNSDGTCYSDGPCQDMATEWSGTVTFANSNAPMELRANAREIFLQPTQTFTVSGTIANTDGSTTTPSTLYFLSTNPSVCTVNSTGVITAVAKGACLVYVMAPQTTGSDLQVTGGTTSPTTANLQSSSHPFVYTSGSRMVEVTGGSGWTTGAYVPKGWINGLMITWGAPASNGATGGQFAIGLTRAVWVYVWTDNILPHFGLDGSVLTAYNPSKSMFVAGMFSSLSGFQDVPYNPGLAADVNAGGYNTFETGINAPGLDLTGGQGQSTFQSIQSSYVTQSVGYISAYPKLRLSLTGDGFTGSDTNLWNVTRGTISGWSPSGLTTMFSSWAGASVPSIWASMKDEVNSAWDHKPLQGPVNFTAGVQSGLTSITSNGSTCTANWTDWSLNGPRKFIITGATTSGFNSAAGSTYSTSTNAGSSPNAFTFSCTVASGTYNSSTDPGLTIEPYGVAWYNGNSDYLHYNAFEQIRAARNGETGGVNMTWPNAAGTFNESVADWSGNGVQSISGVSQIADANDLYWTHNACEELSNPTAAQNSTEPYLAAWSSTNVIIQEMGDCQIREEYGSYNPDMPLLVQTQGVVSNYGFEGYSVGISSCSGATINLSGPHNIPVLLPGVTRLWVTGNSGCNGNYYVTSIAGPQTLQVALTATSFTGTGSGGTLTFQNGDSYTLSSISASGNVDPCGGSGGANGGTICGDTFTYSGSANSAVNKHRGMTFTISGSSVSGFNTNTFIYSPENIVTATTNSNYYRQLPSLSGSGGTATIVADNRYVRGRNGEEQNDNQIGWNFSTVIEAAILRAAGTRLYKFSQSFGDWAETYGFGNFIYNAIFQDTSGQSVQLFSGPHWENMNSVPSFHSTSLANLLLERIQKYLLQPALSSPDYGPAFDACARSGSYGNMLMVGNFTDAPQARTISLTPYLEAGQQIVKMYVNPLGVWTVTSLAAGTASDTVTFDANGVVVYLFPVTYTGELDIPMVSANLADVSGATKLAVRFGYDQYLLDSSANVFGCASIPCSLPADRNIGTIYYRLIFTSSTNQVLATSDVQTM